VKAMLETLKKKYKDYELKMSMKPVSFTSGFLNKEEIDVYVSNNKKIVLQNKPT
jgi:hypothetical protein